MTHRSKRELARTVGDLERELGETIEQLRRQHSDEYDLDRLSPNEKQVLADLFDVGPWNRAETQADEILGQLHREGEL